MNVQEQKEKYSSCTTIFKRPHTHRYEYFKLLY